MNNTRLNETQKVLNNFGVSIKPEAEIASLTIAKQQMVEIVKAISFNAKIVVMDEPTSSLADKEVTALFDIIHRLTAKGIGVIYISHRMSELQQIADRVTVSRDGEYAGTRIVRETSNDELIAMMVGRPMTHYYARTFNKCDETVLKVNNLCSAYVHNVSFELKKGEILGFAGLIGAGRSETMKAIFGIDKITGGTVELNGKAMEIKNTAQMIEAGICLVPEDRKNESIYPNQSLKFNMTLSGMVLSARSYSGNPIAGDGAEMDAIAAVVLGGTSMAGGSGFIGGTIIGALIIGILSNGLNLMGIDSFWQIILKGAVILVAVYVDYLKNLKKNKTN